MQKLALGLILASSLAFAVTPDCSFTQQFTNDPTIQPNGSTIIGLGGAPAPAINNNLGGSSCQAWTLLYSFTGVTASSVELDVGTTPSGTFSLWPGTVNYGQNPYQKNENGYVNLTGTYNYLRFAVKFISGIGTVTVQGFGWINPANVGSIVNYPTGGGGSGTVGSGTTGQFGYYSSSGTAIVGHTLTFSDISGLFTGTPSSTTYARGDGTWATITGGTPGGTNGQIQYNNSGAFGGISTTGTGNAVLATSPTLVTPALGTPSALVLTNATGLPGGQITGANSIPASTLPLATTGAFGAVKPDGTSITISAGVISATGVSAGVASLASGSSGALSCTGTGTPATGAVTCDGVTSVLSYQNNAETWGGAKTVNNIFTTELAVASTDATIASATTIAPTTSLVFVTGTTPIATITPSTGCTTSGIDCFLTLVADPSTGPFTFTTAGNIYATYTATVGQAVRLVYFPAKTKWYQIH